MNDDFKEELKDCYAEIKRLRAAIAIIRGETLEEAAQTAELDECGCCTCIAAAIRALKEGK